MKKILKITGITLASLLVILVCMPFFFKGKILEKIQREIDAQLNARVYFGAVSLSFIRSFPDARITLHDLGVVGVDIFERDTLFQASELILVADIMTIVRGEDILLKKVSAQNPFINLLVLNDGTANYDILKSEPVTPSREGGEAQPDSTHPGPATPPPSAFKVNLQAYALKNARIRYYDETFPMTLDMKGVDHKGSGDFTAIQYNLLTTTSARQLDVLYDGITYFTKARATAEAKVRINTKSDYRFELLENILTINDMKLTLDGEFTMRPEDYLVDITFRAPETDFKSLFSLVPGVYTEDFKDIKAEGALEFSGFMKGVYSETQFPGYGLHLIVPEARIQYPNLPTPVTGIRIDLKAENPDGNPENSVIDIKAFHADLGANPIDIQGRIAGSERLQVKGAIQAKLNLEELTTMFPIEGAELKGLFVVDAQADGTYDEVKGLFPKVNARMELTDGFARNQAYPTQLSDFFFKATLTDESGKITQARFDAPEFRFLLDGDPIRGSACVENFDDPFFKVAASGKLDLEKLLQLYPVEGLFVKGLITVEEFATQGRYSDVEAERYERIPTRGKITVNDLTYRDASLPAPITVTRAAARFTPTRMEIESATGALGRSDYALSGFFTNYLGYALLENEPLKGSLSFSSKVLDLNEWMGPPASEPAVSSGAKSVQPANAPASSGDKESAVAASSVIPVPANLDIVLQAVCGEVYYEQMKLVNLRGKMTIADQVLNMEEASFDLLGGKIVLNGNYNTQNIRKPSYSFFMDVRQLGIRDAFNTFRFIRAYVPVAETVTGKLNTQLGLKGSLRQDMTPVMETLDGQGLFEVINGGISQSPVLQMIADRTKVRELAQLQLNDLKGRFEINNGFLRVNPFDIRYKDIVITLGGRQNLAGLLDYDLALDLPSGMVGQAAYSAIANLTGGAVQPSERIVINLKLGGFFSDPKLTGGGGGTVATAKNQAAQAAEDQIQSRLGVDVTLQKDSLKAAAQQAAEQLQDTLRQAAQAAKQQAIDSLRQRGAQVGDKLKEQAAEELKKAAGEDAKKALEDLKNKFGVPKKKGN